MVGKDFVVSQYVEEVLTLGGRMLLRKELAWSSSIYNVKYSTKHSCMIAFKVYAHCQIKVKIWV